MFDKLELLIEKFEELERKIIDPEIMKDMNVWQKLAKEHGDMKPIIEKYKEYSKHKKELLHIYMQKFFFIYTIYYFLIFLTDTTTSAAATIPVNMYIGSLSPVCGAFPACDTPAV